MARRSKAKRRAPVRLDMALGVLIGLNILTGLRYSPLICLRHVRVTGAQTPDESMIRNIFETATETPVEGIRNSALETSFQRLPEIDSAKFEANIFGSGRLRLHYRTPVARIGTKSLALDARGDIWKTRQPLTDLPSVSLPASRLTAGMALVREAPSQAIADLAIKLPSINLRPIGEIVLDDGGTVCLNRGNRGRIVFGGTEAMDEKLTRLAGLLLERPALFAGSFEVNLTAPAHPVFLPIESTQNETAEHPKP